MKINQKSCVKQQWKTKQKLVHDKQTNLQGHSSKHLLISLLTFNHIETVNPTPVKKLSNIAIYVCMNITQKRLC